MILADLHVHSKWSRGCSKDLTLENTEKYARIKGISLMGTGDFTHPEWIKELKQLDERDGLLYSKSNFPFMLTTEISLIYKQGERTRKIHNVVLAPSIEVVEQVTEELKKIGRVDYDGRPIFKLPCPDFVELLRGVSKDIEVIPAHIWTPWFSLFGSNSGFDHIKDAFGDQTKHIHCLETGMSSDPQMNRRLSQLDNFNMVSFSDAHSYWPWRIGREATIIDAKLTYKDMLKKFRTPRGIHSTIEVDPHYGKYHYDGHRDCNVCRSPNLNDTTCPVCGKTVTIGVLHRIEELADRPEEYQAKHPEQFSTLLPLSELISRVYGKGINTKTVASIHETCIKRFDNELAVLQSASETELNKIIHPKLTQAILNMRKQDIEVVPGYDGVYGYPKLPTIEIQKGLGSYTSL